MLNTDSNYIVGVGEVFIMINFKKIIKMMGLSIVFLYVFSSLDAAYTPAQASTILTAAGYTPSQITNLIGLSGCANTDPVCAEIWHSNIQNQVEDGINALTASNAATLAPNITTSLNLLFSVVGFDASSCPGNFALGSASQVVCFLNTRLQNKMAVLLAA